MARCQGRGPARRPAGVSAGRRPRGHQNAVAVGGQRHQAQPARHRGVLRHREGLAGQSRGPTRGCTVAGGDQRCCHLPGALGLRARGGRDTAVPTTQRAAATGQAHAARPACAAHEVDGQHQPGHPRASGTTGTASGDIGTASQGVLPCPPGWQRGAGPLQLLRRVTLGQALGAPRTRGRAAVRTCAALPAWLAALVALWRVVADGSHRDLRGHALALG
jgi:hypothetical protein